MKTIPRELVGKLEEFEVENGLLPSHSLEKDFHVVDVLRVIVAIPADRYFRLVFCGGTCLAKAYGILERMSEDVDFKIVPTQAGAKLGNAARRRELSNYVKSVAVAIEAGGFGEGSVTRRSRDSNRYTALDITFEPVFPKPESLRPHVLVELNYTTLAGPTEIRKAGALYDRLLTGSYKNSMDVECVSLREVLAEKLISFPRRLAMQRAKNPEHPELTAEAGWDRALVRHLYDLERISAHHPEAAAEMADLSRMVGLVIEKDALDFANQHPAFIVAPRQELLSALEWAQSSTELRNQYDSFVADMVYADPATIPSYEAVLGNVRLTIEETLSRIDCASISASVMTQLRQ
jgi:predicted nucleotidyltransferase component of viral defense system